METEWQEQVHKLLGTVFSLRPAQRWNKRWAKLGQLVLDSRLILHSVEGYRVRNLLPKDTIGVGKAIAGTIGDIVERRIHHTLAELSKGESITKRDSRLWVAFLERDPICYHQLLYQQDRPRYDDLNVQKAKLQGDYSLNERALSRDYEEAKQVLKNAFLELEMQCRGAQADYQPRLTQRGSITEPASAKSGLEGLDVPEQFPWLYERHDDFEQYLTSYLEALRQRYKKVTTPWEEELAPLDMSEIVPSELTEDTTGKEKQHLANESSAEAPSNEPTDRNLKLWEAVKESQRLLILGDPGAGKSTCLQWITHTYTERMLGNQQKELPVPIYVELQGYMGNLLQLVATSLVGNGVVCDQETIKEWLKKGGFLFLLDGLDESGDLRNCLKDVKLLAGLSAENRFVITSRRIELLRDLKQLQFKKLVLKELSLPQVELLLEKRLGKVRAHGLLRELEKHNLVNEARNPLILWFMALEFRAGKGNQIPLNKGMLFKRVIERHFLSAWDTKAIPSELSIQKYTDLKIEVLSNLAFHMIDERNLETTEEGQVKDIFDRHLQNGRPDYRNIRDEILRQLLVHHILVRREARVSFWHKSLRDYFAALELMIRVADCPKEFARCYTSEKWQDPTLFLVGIMNDPSDLVGRLVQPLWRYFLTSPSQFLYKLSLAAKCIGASNRVNIATQQAVIDQLVKIAKMGRRFRKFLFYRLHDVSDAVLALGETRSDLALSLLKEIVDGRVQSGWLGSQPLRQEAVKAIGNIPSVEAQYSLLPAALRDEDGVVRLDARDVLRENMTHETASRLIELMLNKSEKKEVRQRAIDIMCGFADEDFKYPDRVMDPLIQIALEEEYDDLRTSAAAALHHRQAEAEEKRIVSKLIDALRENPDTSTAANAVYALIYHFSSEVRKALIEALNSNNAEVLRRAAYALSRVGTKTLEEEKEASQKLSKLFSHEDTDVRINALWAYGIICYSPTREGISQLIDLLRDENVQVRLRAAQALGCLKATSALPQLKQMVENEKYVYPWAKAIWAILRIEPSFADIIKENGWEHPYISMLYNDDLEERRMAATVLEDIGTEIALPFLKEAKGNRDKNRSIGGELFYAIDSIEARSSTESS